jgi:hypothetical protein
MNLTLIAAAVALLILTALVVRLVAFGIKLQRDEDASERLLGRGPPLPVDLRTRKLTDDEFDDLATWAIK